MFVSLRPYRPSITLFFRPSTCNLSNLLQSPYDMAHPWLIILSLALFSPLCVFSNYMCYCSSCFLKNLSFSLRFSLCLKHFFGRWIIFYPHRVYVRFSLESCNITCCSSDVNLIGYKCVLSLLCTTSTYIYNTYAQRYA